MKSFWSVALTADAGGVLAVAFFLSATPAQAKDCSAERPSNARSHWSYRVIDGRKCWYEGRPMMSKSLLQWPASRTEQTHLRPPPAGASENRPGLLNAQASISEDRELKPKPQAKAEVIDAGRDPNSRGTLTAEDLRAWGNSMAAMTAEPVMTILDRWPDKELPQHLTKPTPVDPTSSMNTRAIMMGTILLMALLAVLMTTSRNNRRTHNRVQP